MMTIRLKGAALVESESWKRYARTFAFWRIRFLVLAIFAVILAVTPTVTLYGQGLLRPRTGPKEQNVQNTSTFIPVPWDELDDRPRQRIQEVIRKKTIFRHLPQQVGYCDPEMYDFMTNHPDVVIELWKLLGITHISLQETGPDKYHLIEGTATVSDVEVVYKNKNLCIAYAIGEYDAPMLQRKIKGEVVLFLRSRFGHDKENRPIVQSDLDAYVRIHNPGAEMLAKILTPIVGKIADSNFEQTIDFVRSVSAAAQEDYEVIQEYAGRLQEVRPEVAKEFGLTAEMTYDREVERYIKYATTSPEIRDDFARQQPAPAPTPAPAPAISPRYALRSDTELEARLRAFQSDATNPNVPDYSLDPVLDAESLMILTPLSDDFDSRFIPYSSDKTPLPVVQGRGRMSEITPPKPLLPGTMAFEMGESLLTEEPVDADQDTLTLQQKVPQQAKLRQELPSPLAPKNLTIHRDNRVIGNTIDHDEPMLKGPESVVDKSKLVTPVPALSGQVGQPTLARPASNSLSPRENVTTNPPRETAPPANSRIIIGTITAGPLRVGSQSQANTPGRNNRQEQSPTPAHPQLRPSPSPLRFGSSSPVTPPQPTRAAPKPTP